MGREALVRASYAGREGEAKALLESEGVILRKPLGARIPREAMRDLAVDGDRLTGEGPEGFFWLALGSAEAERWKAALSKPLPTLAEKLGVAHGRSVWTFGDMSAAELAEALSGMEWASPEAAELRLARAASAEDLEDALNSSAAASTPIWIIHGKGRGAFNDASVREVMRARGFVDVKASAVSAELSATLYRPR